MIKNTKTKTAIAIRQLVAAHRVILTGTPIQNGVNELWALFDFLMPGYLGENVSTILSILWSFTLIDVKSQIF